VNRDGGTPWPQTASRTGWPCTAAYDVASLADAARLAAAVTEVPGLAGSGALMTVTDARLTVRLGA
jgi:hypothetical protein